MATKDLRENYHQQWLERKDQEAIDLDNTRAFRTFSQFFKDILKREFKGKLLDLGSGDGTFVTLCQSMGLEAKGLDFADGLDFERNSLPVADESFDIILMYSLIEHISNPSILLNESRRALKPGGILLLVTPNIDTCGSSFYDDHTHVRPYNPKGLTRLMSSMSLKERFIGLWTVGKSSSIWRKSRKTQFFIGKHLPFSGRNKWAPEFLKGKSVTMLAAFEK